MGFWETVVAGIIGAAVGGLLLALVLTKSDRPRAWANRVLAVVRQTERIGEQEQLEVLREQVAEVALKLGIRLPVSRSGEVVTFNDGCVARYITDPERYRNMMNAGAVNPLTTHRGSPPTTLRERDRAWLEEWLRANLPES